MASPRVILFTGAPSASSVDSASFTLTLFGEPFIRILGLGQQDQEEEEEEDNPEQTEPHAVWRSLPLTRQPFHTSFSQSYHVHDDDSFHRHDEFFTTADVFLSDGETRLLDGDDGATIFTQFCEQSLAAHTSASVSQMDSLDLDTTDETSFMTTSTTESVSLAPPPASIHLSDLEDIPSSSRILALSPQTLTLNIIVAVISIAQPRTVTTRWGKTLSLVEVLVGDETKSGFAVTFWLSSDEAATGDVTKLRRQDVVLMENVALHVFRGKVYGQSLRKNLTRVRLLWRRDGGGHYSARDLSRRVAVRHPQQEKTRQVKDWVLRFFGRDASTTTAARRVPRKSWDRPPDDTQ